MALDLPNQDSGIFVNDMNSQIGLKMKVLNSIRQWEIIEQVVLIEL